MSDWIIGAGARIRLDAATAEGLPIDPDVVRVKVMTPAGTVTTYTYGNGPDVVRDALGQYHLDVPLDKSGRWHWRWETDAPQTANAEGQISVAKSRFIQEAP